MWAVARRPRWIALLLLALAVAAAFAALGQWQLDRSIASGTVVERETETVKPLGEITEPQVGMSEPLNGQLVEVSGTFVSGDFTIVSDRLNAGDEGFWVVGHLEADATAHGQAAVAVALGWAPSREAAASARDTLRATETTVVGRYVAPEPPQLSDFENGEVSQLAPAALVNEWEDFSGRVYAGYVVADAEVAGLERIDAPQASDEVSLNWLNIFYAIEWSVFAVFAVFLWYRLVKDVWEREEEERAEVRADVGGSP